MRVLYIHHDGAISGSAISLRTFLMALDRDRFIPTVLLAAEGPARSLFEDAGISVDVISMRPFVTQPSPPWYQWDYRNNWMALARSRACEDYISARRPDLVHVNDKAALAGGRAAHRCSVPVIWHLRSSYKGGHSRIQNRISRKIIRRAAARVIAISEDETDGFDDLPGLRIINNAVDIQAAACARTHRARVRAELGLADGEVAVGMVGQLTAQKGAWDFIKAAGIARRRAPDVQFRFVMIAPVPGRDQLNWGLRGRLHLVDTTHPVDRVHHLSEAAGLQHELLLTGGRRDVLSVMAAMDIVTCCYRMHAIGRPAFEAMAVGRPVITNAGHTGRSTVVRDGETGVIVRSGDIGKLAEAIVTLGRDPDSRRRIGDSGARYAAEKFDAEHQARRVEQVYAEALACSSLTSRS